MINTNIQKSKQLGIPFGTAQSKLRKMVLFHVLKKYNANFCFRCKKKILSVDEFSIDHKKPWLHENINLFWSMRNIAFSHLHCNICASRVNRPTKGTQKHGTDCKYHAGCRCGRCTLAHAMYRRGQRARKKMKEISISTLRT
jgi:hypothetical protein